MTFTKQGAFTKKPTDIIDVPSPSWTPDMLREAWETPSNELKTTFNALVDKLNATADGVSGADNIGATGFDGLASNIQALLDYLKANKTDLTGNHLGEWQGFTPSQADPGISSVVDSHTAQLAEKSIHVTQRGMVAGTDITTALSSLVVENNGLIPIYFPPSILPYIISSLKIITNGTTLIIPKGATIKLKDATISEYMIQIIAKDVTLDGGGTIDGNRDNVSYGNMKTIRINGSDVSENPGVVERVKIKNLELKNCQGEDTIYFTGHTTNGWTNTDCEVSGCHIHDSDRNAVTIVEGKKITVRDNWMWNVRRGVDIEPNIADQKAVDNLVINNHIWNCVGGIDLAGEGNLAEGNIITDLIDDGSLSACGILNAGVRNKIKNNIVKNVPAVTTGFGYYGVGSSYSDIQGNSFINCGQGGMRLVTRDIVIGNYIYGSGTKAILCTASGCVINNNYLHHEATDTMTIGIDLANTGGNIVSGNQNRLLTDAVMGIISSDLVIANPGEHNQWTTGQHHIGFVLYQYTTAERNALAHVRGLMVYDRSLEKPVWSNGTVWKDASGVTV